MMNTPSRSCACHRQTKFENLTSRSLRSNKENAKGLDKFEIWLGAQNLRSDKMMEFLRKLQALRSAGTAHRKGDNYEKLKPFFEMDKKELTEVLEDIFIKCVWTLRTLEKFFLPDIPKEEDVKYST